MGQILSTGWQPDHSDALVKFIADGLSYAEAAGAINAEFQTGYSRNACIGKARRLSITSPERTVKFNNRRERDRAVSAKRKAERWKANPSLKERAARMAQQKINRAIMLANGATRTSPEFRKHVPRPPEMTKNELRAMLTTAVQNTAAMEIA